MGTNTQLLFFFSALGAFNGLLLSTYFLFLAKPKQMSNYFLGGLLLALSTRIGKSVFFFFNPALAKIYLQIGLTACFFIGPFLWLFVQAKLFPDRKLRFAVPLLSLLLLATISIGYLYPYELNPTLWGDSFYPTINYCWLAFIMASVYLMRGTFQKVGNREKLGYDEIWVLSVLIGVTAIWLAYFTSSYTSYIVGALSFSFVFYLSIMVILAFRKQHAIKEGPKVKYANKKIESFEAETLLGKIEELMQEEKLYRDPNLSLSRLAKKLRISPHRLSQLLNDNLQKRFTQFINEYRIEEAKALLRSDNHLKMEVVAEECGFNSPSTFYTAFKKFTNTTPARFMSEN